MVLRVHGGQGRPDGRGIPVHQQSVVGSGGGRRAGEVAVFSGGAGGGRLLEPAWGVVLTP